MSIETATLTKYLGDATATGAFGMLKFKDLRESNPRQDNESRADWDKRISKAMADHVTKARNGAPVVLAHLQQNGLYMAGGKVLRNKAGDVTGFDMKLRTEKKLQPKKESTADLKSQIAALTAKLDAMSSKTVEVTAEAVTVEDVK